MTPESDVSIARDQSLNDQRLAAGVVDMNGYKPAALIRSNALRAAALLQSFGVREGDAVALLLKNSSTFLEVTVAAQHLGAYPVPINWHFAPPEVDYILRDCAAKVVIGEASLLAAIDEAPAGVHFIAVDAPEGHWADVLAKHAPVTAAARPPVQSMVYTSGTTGKPKGVRRAPPTDEQQRGMVQIRDRIYSARPGMRLLLPAPMYHSAPNLYSLHTLRNDGLLILPERFDPVQLLEMIEQHGVTHLFMVPTMFVRLLALPPQVRAKFDHSTLESVLHAGAPCPSHVKAAMIEWWGPVIREYYGSTEMAALTFATSDDARRHPGTVGRPLDGIALRIRDQAGAECAVGVPGEIHVAKTVQPDFTYHQGAGKRADLEHDGELATGDVGYFNTEGYLFLCDRRHDMIISGGVNIYPAEIEGVMATIDGIDDAAVFGIPDDEFGESVVAVVQLRPGVATDAKLITEELRLKVAGYKVPRQILFTSQMPRDESGKLFKRKLRALLLEKGRID